MASALPRPEAATGSSLVTTAARAAFLAASFSALTSGFFLGGLCRYIGMSSERSSEAAWSDGWAPRDSHSCTRSLCTTSS